jgi:Ca2+-binding EF-hand superfamily protein
MNVNRAKRQRNKTKNIEKPTTVTTRLVINSSSSSSTNNNYSNCQSFESLKSLDQKTNSNTNIKDNIKSSSTSLNSSNNNNNFKKRVIVTEKLNFTNSSISSSSSTTNTSLSNLPIPSVMGLARDQSKITNQSNNKKTHGEDADEISHNSTTSEQNSSFDCKELTEDDIEFLMDNTGFNCEQIRRWHVEFLNKCPTGLITFDQFKAYYKILLPSSLSDKSKEEIVLKLFQLFDIDADGRLNFAEFLISFWIRCKAPLREKFTWVFNMLDLDRNGYLSYYEIRDALSLCMNKHTLNALLEQLNKEVNKERGGAISTSSPQPVYVNDLSDFSDDDDDDENDDYGKNSPFPKLTTEQKLQQVILLLNLLSQKTKSKSQQDLQKEKEFFLNSMVLFDESRPTSDISSNNSRDDCNSIKSAVNKIQITRENFIDLAEKFKLLRKLVLPIHNFYEDNFSD